MTNSSVSAALIIIVFVLVWTAGYLADHGEIFIAIIIGAVAIFLIYVNGYFDGK